MKSSKQRRKEIKEKRLARARKLARAAVQGRAVQPGIELSDQEQLVHCAGLCVLPEYYKDLEFRCRDCGSQQVWTAKQQKWWYEVAKGHLDTTAVRCRPCRKKERERKAEARSAWAEGIARKNAN